MRSTWTWTPPIEAAYRDWLGGHVAELLALPGFLEARGFDVLEPAAAPGRFALCVHYGLRDEAALQDYLDHHAARMRADGLARFGGVSVQAGGCCAA